MERIRRSLLVTGLLLVIVGIGLTIFVDIIHENNSRNTTIFLFIAQIPVWIYVLTSRQSRKRKR